MEPYAYVRELARRDKLSHAWLLLGEDGEELEKLALFTARALLCSAPAGEEKPCGVCPHCRKMQKGIHPDLGTPVAIKTLLPEYAADRPTRDQFLHDRRCQYRLPLLRRQRR